MVQRLTSRPRLVRSSDAHLISSNLRFLGFAPDAIVRLVRDRLGRGRQTDACRSITSTSTAMLSTSTIQDNPTPEVPTADWDTRFPTAIPIEYIGRQRRWRVPSSWSDA
ncbi:hypothetical protein [Stieleria sedimenti]|uniref:hypothetical protein n=1 Tax=Stieleria sedimenti TaxID=2976331 RepID=UPI00217FE299|nr:hypothetical protein [Stieleria sedimenti]